MGSALGDQPISARFDVGVLETRQTGDDSAYLTCLWGCDCDAFPVAVRSLHRLVSYARSDGHAESPMTGENKRYHECTKLPLPAFGDGTVRASRGHSTAGAAQINQRENWCFLTAGGKAPVDFDLFR